MFSFFQVSRVSRYPPPRPPPNPDRRPETKCQCQCQCQRYLEDVHSVLFWSISRIWTRMWSKPRQERGHTMGGSWTWADRGLCMALSTTGTRLWADMAVTVCNGLQWFTMGCDNSRDLTPPAGGKTGDRRQCTGNNGVNNGG